MEAAVSARWQPSPRIQKLYASHCEAIPALGAERAIHYTDYYKNIATADALAHAGFRVLPAEDILLGREEVTLDGTERVCLLIDSHEMSRARGGPHCLTHPLQRNDV